MGSAPARSLDLDRITVIVKWRGLVDFGMDVPQPRCRVLRPVRLSLLRDDGEVSQVMGIAPRMLLQASSVKYGFQGS